MLKQPKRRKDKSNPYTLIHNESNNKYIVSFIDSNNKIQTIEIDESLYNLFNNFELEDISQMNKFDRYIEHSEVFEETLFRRAIGDTFCLEDEVIRKTEFEELNNAINMLPDIQKRRIKMYYYEEMTQQQIADLEGVNIRNVQASLNIAIKNIKKIIKK